MADERREAFDIEDVCRHMGHEDISTIMQYLGSSPSKHSESTSEEPDNHEG